jgi:thiol peroxidase
MAETALRGNTIHTAGDLPAIGTEAPSFTLTKGDLGDLTVDDLAGQKVVLNIFPSIDTPTCAASVREFNKRAAGRDGATVVCVSADLPFAQSRFCGAEGIENVTAASAFRSDFGTAYGVQMVDGPL